MKITVRLLYDYSIESTIEKFKEKQSNKKKKNIDVECQVNSTVFTDEEKKKNVSCEINFS